MYKLVILRHGESEWNLKNRFTGWEDVDLTEKGIDEAKNAGKLLKENCIDINLAFTSLLVRAQKTLKYCISELGSKNIDTVKDWRLNERHYGSLQGLNKLETVKKYGEEQVQKWRRSYDVPPPKMHENNKSHPKNLNIYSSIDDELLPSSESLEDVVNRFLPLWDKKIKTNILSGKNILIVAHGNSLRALVMYLKKMSRSAIIKFNIPTGYPMVFELNHELNVDNNYYLGNQEEIKKKTKLVANQSSLNQNSL